MLPESLLSGSLLRYHGDFLERYKDELDIDLTCGRGSAGEKKEETLSSFSFQWTEFSEMFPEWEQNFKDYLEPLVEQSFFRGKLVLDAGCGFGRHAYYSAKYGAEVVGFDLSEAVQTAHKNTREFAEVHIVQGDIYALPFRAEFDFIYSIGVLHHLPDPVSGLADLSNCLKQGGQIYVWVYGKRRGVKRIYVIVDFLRKFTTKMSYRPLYLFTLGLACLSHLSFVYPYKLLNSIGLKRIASILPFTAYARFPFRVSHTDWFDRLSVPLVVYLDRDDVEDWFENVGLNDVRISQKNGASWRLVGTRP